MNQLFARKINFTSVAEDTSITAAVKSVMLLVQHSIFSSIMEYLAPKKKNRSENNFQSRAGKNFNCGQTKIPTID